MKLGDIAKTPAARKLVNVGRPASPRSIAAAERALAVELSPSLRDYLASFGWLAVEEDQLFGLGRAPRWRRLVEVTQWERTSGCPLPRDLIPLLNDGAGNLYCVDVRTDRVVFWDHDRGPTQKPSRIAATLRGWLASLVRDHVRWQPERKLQARAIEKQAAGAVLSRNERAVLAQFGLLDD